MPGADLIPGTLDLLILKAVSLGPHIRYTRGTSFAQIAIGAGFCARRSRPIGR